MVMIGHILALLTSHSGLIVRPILACCLRRFGSGLSDPKPPAQRTARTEPAHTRSASQANVKLPKNYRKQAVKDVILIAFRALQAKRASLLEYGRTMDWAKRIGAVAFLQNDCAAVYVLALEL